MLVETWPPTFCKIKIVSSTNNIVYHSWFMVTITVWEFLFIDHKPWMIKSIESGLTQYLIFKNIGSHVSTITK